MDHAYMPAIGYAIPANRVLGVESIAPAAQLARLLDCNAKWVRWNGVRWPDDVRHADLEAMNSLQARSIVVVQANGFIPDLQQQYMLAQYVTCLAGMYPNIYAWEVWNEPDAPIFRSTVYLGGGWADRPEEYAAFLKMVVEHNPGVRILSGGLAGINEWARVVLQSGVKPHGVSFHSYQYMPWINVYKLAQEVVQLRAWTDLPLYLTETSLLSDTDDNDVAKAEYLQMVYDYAMKEKLPSAIWYTVGGNGWMNSDLENVSLTLFRELND